MAFVVLQEITRVSAVATCERLAALGIEAQILDQPNLLTKLSTGGRYVVRVAVDESELERARVELARWELEAAPRIAAQSRQLRTQLLLGSLPAALLSALIASDVLANTWALAILPAWLAGVVAVMLWKRHTSGRPPPRRTG